MASFNKVKVLKNVGIGLDNEVKVDKANPISFFGWDLVTKKGEGYKVEDVQNKLVEFGLPEEANDIKARNAVLRALRDAETGSKDLVVLVDDADKMIFQLTSISREDDVKYGKIAKYLADAHITFVKKTNEIECDNKLMLKYLHDRFAISQEFYRTHDITKILLRIFTKHGDIMPLRSKGGAYVIPSSSMPYALKAKEFIKSLNPSNVVTLFRVSGDSDTLKDMAEIMVNNKAEELKRFRQEIIDMEAEDVAKGAEGKKTLSSQAGVKKTRQQRLAVMKKKIALWNRTLQCESEELDLLLKKCDNRMKKYFGA